MFGRTDRTFFGTGGIGRWQKKATTFEAAVTRLDEIVKQLEEGGESLDSSMKLFEEGSALATLCYEKLKQAEQKITQLSALEKEEQA